jgi:murein DD-endopeptidase MepM/ murein hydrolase activator NlpD
VPTFAEAEEPEDSQSEVVAAFLERQAAFSDYAVPANVSYTMPALPFTYQSPVPDKAGSGFGYRLHPLDGLVKFHYGTDIPANSGDDIFAFAGGTVSFVGEDDSYGKFLILDHGKGIPRATRIAARFMSTWVNPYPKGIRSLWPAPRGRSRVPICILS